MQVAALQGQAGGAAAAERHGSRSGAAPHRQRKTPLPCVLRHSHHTHLYSHVIYVAAGSATQGRAGQCSIWRMLGHGAACGAAARPGRASAGRHSRAELVLPRPVGAVLQAWLVAVAAQVGQLDGIHSRLLRQGAAPCAVNRCKP